jgi:hypothetical protein
MACEVPSNKSCPTIHPSTLIGLLTNSFVVLAFVRSEHSFKNGFELSLPCLAFRTLLLFFT